MDTLIILIGNNENHLLSLTELIQEKKSLILLVISDTTLTSTEVSDYDHKSDNNKYAISYILDETEIDYDKIFSSYKINIFTVGLFGINSNLTKSDYRLDLLLPKTNTSNLLLLRDSILTCIDCLDSRGGLLQRSYISKFLKCNVLLNNASSNTSPSSYDLRLGDDVWCKGAFIRLSENTPLLSIPPYSYAIVSAKETANLPSFIAARFDLKNSLFFRGIILSNGPQVDPGYRGALFCMLYNGSDTPVGIKREEHFASIEFITTTNIGEGYNDHYQGKTKLIDFMPSDAWAAPGGQIIERTQEKIDDLIKNWKLYRNIGIPSIFAFLGLIITPAFFITQDLRTQERETSILFQEIKQSRNNDIERLKSTISNLERKVDILEKKLTSNNSQKLFQLEKELQQIQNKIGIKKPGYRSWLR